MATGALSGSIRINRWRLLCWKQRFWAAFTLKKHSSLQKVLLDSTGIKQGSANDAPAWGGGRQIQLPRVFTNKVLLAHSHVHSFMCNVCFGATTAELSTYDRDFIA